MKTPSPSLLRLALRGNALFSTLCGLTLLLAAGPLAPPLGIPALALRIVGASLLPFAVGLWRNAARQPISRKEAWVAVGLDLGWVAGSAVLILGELWPLEVAGRWAVIAAAEVVLLWAILQILGLRRSQSLAMS